MTLSHQPRMGLHPHGRMDGAPGSTPGRGATEDLLEGKLRRSFLQRMRQARGAMAETLVKQRLQAAGLRLVEKVEVPTGMRGGRKFYKTPVSGDFRAIIPPHGRSVLVEVKCRDHDRLLCSDVEHHQAAALSIHHQAGGLSLVAWYRSSAAELLILPWERLPQLRTPRCALTWDEASAIAATFRINP